MARVQGLMFALATTLLVAAATFYFTKTWLPPLKSDRGAIDHSIFLSLVVTGAVFIGTNLTLAWFSYRYQDAPGARAAHWHDNIPEGYTSSIDPALHKAGPLPLMVDGLFSTPDYRVVDVVMHLPNFRVKQDAVPGMTVETWFTPKESGDFDIACAEHCGLGHYRMRGQVHVVAQDAFDAALKAAIE